MKLIETEVAIIGAGAAGLAASIAAAERGSIGRSFRKRSHHRRDS